MKDLHTGEVTLLDGAMGTYYTQKYPSEIEAEEANLLYPEQIVEIHKEYIEAGAKWIRTNTFAINHHLFPKWETAEQALRSAISNARVAILQTGKEVRIAASIGPIPQLGDEDEADLWTEYQKILQVFFDEGITTFFFETFSEWKWLPKLASYCKEQQRESLVIAGFSLNPMGYTQHGYSVDELILAVAKNPQIDILSFNCGIGAVHMNQLLERQTFPQGLSLCVLPNAGYQQEIRGRLRFSNEPDYYAKQMLKLMELGADFIGGCCGTTPQHIRAVAKLLADNPCVRAKRIQDIVEEKTEPITETTAFIEKLNAGKEKVFVVELDAPFDSQIEKFRKGIFALKENKVDMVTVSDSPMARSRADASLLAVFAKHCADLDIMPHIAMRDRNLIGLRSEILGAHINGIRDFLIITGDPVGPENRGKITGVFDMNSIRFMEYLRHMNEEIFGEKPVYYGGALNYAGTNIDAVVRRMQMKLEMGCSYFLTQPIFSDADIQRIRDLKKRVDAKIICGIMPIVSYRNALFLQNEMIGIHVDERIVSLYRPDMSREEAENVAVELSVHIAEKLSDVADGYYLMTPFHRVELVNRIITKIRSLS